MILKLGIAIAVDSERNDQPLQFIAFIELGVFPSAPFLAFFVRFEAAGGNFRFFITPTLLIASQWSLEFLFSKFPCTLSPAILVRKQ